MVFSLVCSFLFALYVLRKNIKAEELDFRSNKSELLRIMANHWQVLLLVQSLRLEWPDFVLNYYQS